MASIYALTNALLKVKAKQSLDDFIADQVKAGNDAYGIQVALFAATGQKYDERTIGNWIERYGK